VANPDKVKMALLVGVRWTMRLLDLGLLEKDIKSKILKLAVGLWIDLIKKHDIREFKDVH